MPWIVVDRIILRVNFSQVLVVHLALLGIILKTTDLQVTAR